MNNNSIIKNNLFQVIAMILGAAILTTLTQRSFDSIGTAIDEAGTLISQPSTVISQQSIITNSN